MKNFNSKDKIKKRKRDETGLDCGSEICSNPQESNRFPLTLELEENYSSINGKKCERERESEREREKFYFPNLEKCSK